MTAEQVDKIQDFVMQVNTVISNAKEFKMEAFITQYASYIKNFYIKGESDLKKKTEDEENKPNEESLGKIFLSFGKDMSTLFKEEILNEVNYQLIDDDVFSKNTILQDTFNSNYLPLLLIDILADIEKEKDVSNQEDDNCATLEALHKKISKIFDFIYFKSTLKEITLFLDLTLLRANLEITKHSFENNTINIKTEEKNFIDTYEKLIQEAKNHDMNMIKLEPLHSHEFFKDNLSAESIQMKNTFVSVE